MKLARTLRLPAATSFTLGLIVALFSGCKKSESAVVSSDQNIQLRYAWNSATLVGVYEKAGSKNPAWDPWAKAALVEYARSHCLKLTNEPWSKIIATNCANAVRAGCDDPMIEYLYGRFSLDQTNSREVFFEALRKAAQDLQNSSYPSIRKFRAFLHAGIQAGCTYGYGTNVPPRVEHLRLWDSAVQNLQEAIQDKTMPAEDAYEACHALLEEFSGSKEAYRRLFDTLEPALIKNWPNAASTWLLKGAAHIEMAWNGRGGGYANNVTDEGWKVFFAELATAEKALRKSWEMNSNDVRTPIYMIRVAEGEQKPRDEMELWFNRAMKINPCSYLACEYKLHYLYPQWYGSREEMVDFGRQCVATTNWGGNVPLILSDAHREYWLYLEDAEEKTNYWKRADVWPDIQAAFDRFFKLNRDATGYYHNYAWFAYKCERWDELNEVISKLGPVNYDYFGGTNEYEKMVQLAKANTGSSRSTNAK